MNDKNFRRLPNGWLALSILFILAACGEMNESGPVPQDGDAAVDADMDSEDGAETEDALETDETADEPENEEAEIEPLPVPNEPPPIEDPYIDRPYLQEYNHTTNEVEAGIGPLADVALPPESCDSFDRPTQIAPRGCIKHKPAEEGGGFDLIAIPENDPDLKTAAFFGCALFLASGRHVYEVDTEGALTAHNAPDGLTINGLFVKDDLLLILTDGGATRYLPGGEIQWPINGFPATAAALIPDFILIGGDNIVRQYAIPEEGPLEQPTTVLDARNGLNIGQIIGIFVETTLPASSVMVLIGEQGLKGFDLSSGIMGMPGRNFPEFASDRVPLAGPRRAVQASDGGFVVAASGGAYRLMERDGVLEWRVYNQERWLPSEDVRGVATDPALPDGPIWFATAGGLATVTARRVTLEEKLGPFVERIVERHDREGAVADSHLLRRGDLSSNIPWDSDNDGSWTSYWLLAECFRWKATNAPDAKAHFDKSLEAMLRLRDLTGADHFVARAVIRKSTCNLDDCDNPNDGEWFTSPVDPDFWVKGDTSNDEVIAHVFMMGHAYDLCADETQQARIRDHIDGIVGGVIDHDWQLLDIDGEVTTYGQWDPFYVNEGFAGMLGDGGTRSVEIMAMLTLAHYLTGDERYMEAKRYLMEEHHYDVNAINEADYPGRKGSGDGDEMGMEGWFSLLRYESDPLLRERWMEGWSKSWEHLSLQQAAWWDMVNAVVGGPEPDMANSARWLKLAPVDMIRWDQHNSQRLDLVEAPAYYENDGGMRSDGRIIPYDERRCDRWNTDQFRVDGGMGAIIEMDGADVLAPYWMGRYYGFIVSEQEDR
ncbi:MAG: hypothetical protein C4523_04630 [Myxococcales bacterium]|nr:MAG: hypothetical protein C4523_04630 [Myxococcales bacterium]